MNTWNAQVKLISYNVVIIWIDILKKVQVQNKK